MNDPQKQNEERARLQLLTRALRDPELHALRLMYRDGRGAVTLRTVSPVRFEGKEAFLAL